MIFRKPLFAVAAVATLGIVAACDQTAPANPEPTPGPIAQSNALNGTYNLLESNCGDVASDKSLVIDGNKFIFPGSTCTVANSEQQVNRTRVTLSCDGSPSGGNRVVDLQLRPGVLRLTEDSITLTYHQCMRATASSDSLVGQTM
ncbi:hypothetical protein NM680_06875 [Paracoccus sp. PS-1]|uniref:hypothetical protein n=1 Tax=unclassified Paracoccus (in: a-proteobacteria) TaxID=2688777 RepID=UPI00048B834A|nr:MULTISPECIES: hypothetical protein [unclassified Paracoccus (in: a-proteobacteria)]MDQ7261521.1 hypothetical protein [Paracoccus sp. PS1]RQP06886.1 MAG: hypothetical protein D1H97_05485 [Paracoccus sp. BP8]UFM64344.1 hypothetical protein LOS78_02390 [Paracoccus sp. MA]